MPKVSVNVLGPQVVTVGGREIAPLAPQQRRVLSLLASRPGEVLSREWLTAELWGTVTTTLLKGLQSYVSNLRSALEAKTIELVGSGYRLNVDPEAIDEVRFIRLVREGHAAIAAEEYHDGAAHLADALALWRGEPWEDLEHGEFEARRAGLREARLSAEDGLLRARVEMIRDRGGAEALLPASTRAHAEGPRREGRVLQHMRVLTCAGQVPEMVKVAGEFRQRMRSEAGVEPSQEFAMAVASLKRREGPVMPAAWQSGVKAPAFALPILGRDLEIDLIVNLLRGDSIRLLTVAGPSLVGKTRLAGAVTAELAPRLPGGVIWLEAPDTADTEALIAALGRALGEEGSPADLRTRIPRALGARPTLVVLDGVEPPKVRGAAAILLAAGPKVSTVVTAREPLELASEHVVSLQPLSTKPAPGGSPAAAFLAALMAELGGATHPAAELEPIVAGSSGLPGRLEQLAIDVLSGAVAV